MGQCSRCSRCSRCSGCHSIVVGERCFGRWMVMRSVETIGWRDDFSCIEHTSKQLPHVHIVLTCLCGQFFGAKWMARCLQGFEDILSLTGEGCASTEEGCD